MIKPTVNDIICLLKELGLKKGDTVLIHSNIATLGKVENGLEGIFSSLCETLGTNGTLVVPTYTFSFCNNKVFNVQKSKSANGVLTEYIRKILGAHRSLHGIESFASIGKNAKSLMLINDNTCYGPGSVPSNLINFDCKILQIGVPVISHVHYVERLVGVEYRFDKTFSGIIQNKNIKTENSFSLYVRRNDRIVEKTINNDVRREFFASEFCKEIQYAYGIHRLFKVKDYVAFTIEKLKNDPLCLINKDLYLMNNVKSN